MDAATNQNKGSLSVLKDNVSKWFITITSQFPLQCVNFLVVLGLFVVGFTIITLVTFYKWGGNCTQN